MSNPRRCRTAAAAWLRCTGAGAAPVLLTVAAGAGWAAPPIPLCPGLTIVTAVSQPNGDYESIKRIESMDAEGIRLRYVSEAPNRDLFAPAGAPLVRTEAYRRVRAEDLAWATDYQQVFVEDADELIPGTTAIGTSAAILNALKTTGEAAIRISLLPAAAPLRATAGSWPSAYEFFSAGTIARIGTVNLRVIVNDQLVELPAVHARGQVAFEDSEFFFLDDEQNPLTLRMRLGIGAIQPMLPMLAETCAQLRETGAPDIQNMCRPEGGDRDTLQVVKISYQCEGPSLPLAGAGPGGGSAGSGELDLPGGGAGAGGGSGSGGGGGAGAGGGGGGGEGGAAAGGDGAGGAGGTGPSALEQALAETGRADIYSIYFSFNSDVILEESEPTLEEIAELMRKHQDWRLSLNGHTDNIASDSYNLELSRRRANATMRALVERYGISADRLTAAGSGESSPIDTNETLEGRARNRRVELVRLP